MMHEISQTRLKEAFSYDPETGVFVWKIQSGRMKPGQIAGVTNPAGYRMIRLDGKLIMAHRLAWIYMTGSAPTDFIDHINGVRNDNRWVNLRPANRSQNSYNSKGRENCTSKWKGVSWDAPRGKWKAQLRAQGKTYVLGRFEDEREAAEAYLFAALEHQGDYARFA